jgi:hypothetical protein
MKSSEVIGSEGSTETTKETMKITDIWDATQCSSSVLQERDASVIRKNAGGSVKNLVPIYETTVTSD